MDKRKLRIIAISDELLSELLKFKESNPDFTFSLRSRDSVQSKDKRLEEGQWFQGSDYIYVPLFKRGDGARKIKTIGFEISFNLDGSIKDCFIEISFKKGIINPNEISFHTELAAKIGLVLNKNQHGIKLYEDPLQYKVHFNDYLTRFRDLAIAGLHKYNLTEEYLVPEDSFQKKLENILKIKENSNFMVEKEIQIEYPASFPNHGQFQKDFYRDLEIPNEVKSVTVRYNGISYPNLTLGQKNTGRGIIYFPNRGIVFINNNPTLRGGEKIKIKVGWTDISAHSEQDTEKKDEEPLTPLNQILFGPPGTGKTYNTINRALEIIGENIDGMVRKDVKSLFEKRMQEGRIIFTTFHQSMCYEDFIEGIKPLPPAPEEPQSDVVLKGKETVQTILEQSLKYDIRAGIFKRACANSAYLCYKKYLQLKRQSITYSFDDLYDAFVFHVKEQLRLGTLPIYMSITEKEIEIYRINSQDSIKARAKGSQSIHTAPLTKENLQKLYDKFESIEEIENLQQIKDTVQVLPRSTEFYAIFRGIKEFEITFKPEALEEVAVDIIDEIEKQKKFDAGVYNNAIKVYGKDVEPVVLIIDEINRGNVSQIFGELITLIEEDKRIGKAEELEVILPYSQKKFGVPPNLYIIGTMNTADRSVEALDTALRRRFSFVEVPPKYDLDELKYEFVGTHGSEILRILNKRIEKLLDKDHQIGHYYFMVKDGHNVEKKLINSFYKNIIPLLQEYFFGDYGKIGLVLGKGFIKMNDWDKDFDSFAEFEYQSSSEFAEREVFGIIDYREPQTKYILKIKEKDVQMDFQKAIKLLMKQDIE